VGYCRQNRISAQELRYSLNTLFNDVGILAVLGVIFLWVASCGDNDSIKNIISKTYVAPESIKFKALLNARNVSQ
jgi:hypothetical protein